MNLITCCDNELKNSRQFKQSRYMHALQLKPALCQRNYFGSVSNSCLTIYNCRV